MVDETVNWLAAFQSLTGLPGLFVIYLTTHESSQPGASLTCASFWDDLTLPCYSSERLVFRRAICLRFFNYLCNGNGHCHWPSCFSRGYSQEVIVRIHVLMFVLVFRPLIYCTLTLMVPITNSRKRFRSSWGRFRLASRLCIIGWFVDDFDSGALHRNPSWNSILKPKSLMSTRCECYPQNGYLHRFQISHPSRRAQRMKYDGNTRGEVLIVLGLWLIQLCSR